MSVIPKTYPWGDTFRYNSFARRIREKFGGRIQKLSLDAGFTCPNLDGTLDTGGCTYCSSKSYVPSYCKSRKNIKEQINEGIEFHRWRYRRAGKYFAYFQAYSNTYGPVRVLEVKYREALSHPAIIGITISTRPDCLSPEVLDLLESINEKSPVFLEVGVESCYDQTLSLMHRHHNFQQTEKAIKDIASRSIPVTGHIIFGLPGEIPEQMLAEAEILSGLPLNALKLHQLQILNKAAIFRQYSESRELFYFFSIDRYVEFIVEFLERLNPSISIERFASETPPRFNVVNSWGNIRMDALNKKIESVMEVRDTCQGKKI